MISSEMYLKCIKKESFVVPRMVQLIENGWGTKKSIPQLRVGGHKKVISYFLRNGVASVTPFPVSAVLPRG